MKFLYLAIISAFALAVQADSSFYVGGFRNITCQGHEDGHISCEPGHLNNAPTVDFPDASDPKPTALAIRGADRSEITAEPVPGLEKRLTCNLDSLVITQGMTCFSHCLLKGYCNANCDSSNICHCNCYDKTPWWDPRICRKTTCSK